MLAQQHHPFRILRGRELHQIESLNHLVEPIGVPRGEFQFQDRELGKDPDWPCHFRHCFGNEARLDLDLSVKGDPNRVVLRADPGFALVLVVCFGPRVELTLEQIKPLQRN